MTTLAPPPPAPEKGEGLKPCPFCGSTGDKLKVFDYPTGPEPETFVQCQHCSVMGPYRVLGEAAAIEAWNRRALATEGSRMAGQAEPCDACTTPGACRVHGCVATWGPPAPPLEAPRVAGEALERLLVEAMDFGHKAPRPSWLDWKNERAAKARAMAAAFGRGDGAGGET